MAGLDTTKHDEYFDPIQVDKPCHIIGCGAIGSTVAETLARLGIQKFVLYDFDKVEAHNIPNQMFTHAQIGYAKTSAVDCIIRNINPNAKVRCVDTGWNGDPLAGHIFLAADNAEVLRELVAKNEFNANILSMWDFRMRLGDAQHYGADWKDESQRKAFIASLQYTTEEAKDSSPVSACGTVLSVVTTIRGIVSAGIANFIRYIRHEPVHKMILLDHVQFTLDAY
jgi:hypothetical protein